MKKFIKMFVLALLFCGVTVNAQTDSTHTDGEKLATELADQQTQKKTSLLRKFGVSLNGEFGYTFGFPLADGFTTRTELGYQKAGPFLSRFNIGFYANAGVGFLGAGFNLLSKNRLSVLFGWKKGPAGGLLFEGDSKEFTLFNKSFRWRPDAFFYTGTVETTNTRFDGVDTIFVQGIPVEIPKAVAEVKKQPLFTLGVGAGWELKPHLALVTRLTFKVVPGAGDQPSTIPDIPGVPGATKGFDWGFNLGLAWKLGPQSGDPIAEAKAKVGNVLERANLKKAARVMKKAEKSARVKPGDLDFAGVILVALETADHIELFEVIAGKRTQKGRKGGPDTWRLTTVSNGEVYLTIDRRGGAATLTIEGDAMKVAFPEVEDVGEGGRPPYDVLEGRVTDQVGEKGYLVAQLTWGEE